VDKITVKRSKWGDAEWTSYLDWSTGKNAYCLVVARSGWTLDVTQGRLEVKRNPSGKGWVVVVEGEIVSEHRLKTDAQCAAEEGYVR